ncbi:MAG: alpha/beta hydrolase [Pseudomonadota bacterium]
MLEFIEVETAPNPTMAVIWLHGLGADGNDFVPIVRELKLTGCPPIRFIFPHAETMPVTVNNGYVMRAWYDILGADLTRREDETGLRASQAAIEKLIAAQNRRGIRSESIVLAGFSQGCAMALQTGLRYPEKLAGLICLSGYLPLADKLVVEHAQANRSLPIFMAHGSTDPIVPIDRATASRDILENLGYAVAWHVYPMPHSVCPEEVTDISMWLSQLAAH